MAEILLAEKAPVTSQEPIDLKKFEILNYVFGGYYPFTEEAIQSGLSKTLTKEASIQNNCWIGQDLNCHFTLSVRLNTSNKVELGADVIVPTMVNGKPAGGFNCYPVKIFPMPAIEERTPFSAKDLAFIQSILLMQGKFGEVPDKLQEALLTPLNLRTIAA